MEKQYNIGKNIPLETARLSQANLGKAIANAVRQYRENPNTERGDLLYSLLQPYVALKEAFRAERERQIHFDNFRKEVEAELVSA